MARRRNTRGFKLDSQVAVAVITAASAIIVAYFSFQGNRVQIETPLRATETAQALTALSVTPPTASVEPPTPTPDLPTATPEPPTPESSPTPEPTGTAGQVAPETVLNATRLVGPCPSLYVIPGYIEPADRSPDAFAPIFDAFLDGSLDLWPVIPSEQGHTLFKASLLTTNIVPDNRWVRISNDITILVSPAGDVPDQLNIVRIGQCGGIGEIRTFSPVTLQTGFSEYRVQTTFPEADFFTLEPGEFEQFEFDLLCNAPGRYRVSLEIPFDLMEEGGTLTQSSLSEIICPNAFTLWDGLSFEYLEYQGDFIWNGAAYERP